MQMVDVIIGGRAHSLNYGAVVPEGSRHKQDLAEYFLAKSGRPSWERSTAWNVKRGTVWNCRPQRLVAAEEAPQSARRYIRQG